MNERPSRALVYGALLLQTAISAGTYLCAKHALSFMGWAALVMLRNLGGGALLAVLVAVTPGPALPPKGAWGRVALLGLLGIPLNQVLFIAGLSHSTPAHAALMYALTPLFVLLLGVAGRIERLEPAKIAGVVLALAGATVVVLERAAGVTDAQLAEPRFGDLLILGAVVAWALYTVLGRRLVHEQGAMKATGWSLVAGTLMFMPYGVPEAAQVAFRALPWTVWGAILFLVTLTSVVSYLCWSYALKHLEPSRVAVFSNLQPVATAALSWMVFGERITARLAAGGALVIAGVVVATVRRARPAR